MTVKSSESEAIVSEFIVKQGGEIPRYAKLFFQRRDKKNGSSI